MRAFRSTLIALTETANRWRRGSSMTDATSIMEDSDYAARSSDHGHPVIAGRNQ
jgi:hypothetical protein